MTDQELVRIRLFVTVMRGELIVRARTAREMQHYEGERMHLHNARVADDILRDLREDTSV